MKFFDLHKISQITESFIKKNQRLAYQIDKIEEDEHHVLYQATNLYSLLYCQITKDLNLISKWQEIQQTLFRNVHNKANRYLVYIVPDSLIKQSKLYEELSRAERDERFFRKVFIGLPDSSSKEEIENSLADRIPLWFEERNKVIRQYVPVITDLIEDYNLLKVLSQKLPSAVVKTLGERQRFAYLFEENSRLPDEAKGLEQSPPVISSPQNGPRITGLTVHNFRRFNHKFIDLSGDIVIVYGRNGTGKTTLSDALELSIFSELRRLYGDPDIAHKSGYTYTPYIRAGSNSDNARISVTGRVGDEPFSVETTVKMNATEKLLNGKVVTHEEVLRYFTQNENVNKKGVQDILLHTHFLGQHSIRDFIYGNRLDDNEKITTTRYNLLAEMFGFGEVELLKKRLTSVLAHIKRSKITEAENQIEAVKSQIRGMHQKYGPKCRKDLEEKGYEIIPEAAIKKYYESIHRLGVLIEPNVIKQIAIPDHTMMETFQSTCESVQVLLSSEVKKLKAQATDLKTISRLMTRVVAIFPEITLLNTSSIRKCVDEVLQKMNSSIKAIEEAQQELHAINANVESLNSQIAILNRFDNQFEHYIELLAMEHKETESLNVIQNQKNELLQRHSTLMIKMDQAKANEQSIMEHLDKIQQLLDKHERLLVSFMEVKGAEIALQHQTDRIAVIDAEIIQIEKKLSQLRDAIDSSVIDKLDKSLLLEWESMCINNHFYCPCCGTKYDSKEELEKGIITQLQDSIYRQELRAFLMDIARKNVTATREQLLATIQSHTHEKKKLELSNRAHTKLIVSFKALANELGVIGQPSEIGIREIIVQYKREAETAEQALRDHIVKSLRDEVAKVQATLTTLNDDVHKKHLIRIRKEIIEMTRQVTDIIPVSDLRERYKIQEHLKGLSASLLSLTQRRASLLQKIRSQSVTEQKRHDFEETASEIESLLLRQETMQGYTLNKAPDLEKENLEKQRGCYEFSKEFEELSRLFGSLTAQERSETLQNLLKNYEQEKHRWDTCYHVIEKINSNLSQLSYSGLRKSLDQYGPLINQIYQKFIRHDIFAALILQPRAGKMARKGDLFLRLRSYSGETKYTPASYLSEAQLNILALSIFLTRVMYQNISTLETIFIDDPIQQMDDMNAVAFVDVVLGLSHIGKQVIITTCNHEFYRLIAHKMQSVSNLSFKTVNLDL